MAAFSAKSAGGSVSHSVRAPPFAATVGPRLAYIHIFSILTLILIGIFLRG